MTIDDVAGYLAVQMGLTVGTNIFIGKKPPKPNTLMWVSEYPGLPDEPDLGMNRSRLEFARLQVGSRGEPNDYYTPELNVQLAKTALARVVNTTINFREYREIGILQPPFFLRRDINDRVEIAINVAPMAVPPRFAAPAYLEGVVAQSFGGNRLASCATYTDGLLMSRVAPYNYEVVVIDWGAIPPNVINVIAYVWVAAAVLDTDTPVGSITPAIYDTTNLGTPVATGSIVITSQMALQTITLARPDSSVHLYVLLPILAGGATADTVRIQGQTVLLGA
jgi:hypothetical protein